MEAKNVVIGLKAYQFFHLPFFLRYSFTIPYVLTGIFLGPEFPSIIGGLTGLAIVTIAIKNNFLIPKDQWDFPPINKWPTYWLGNIKISLEKDNKNKKINDILAWFPYIFLALLLVISRTYTPLTNFLKTVDLKFLNILDEEKNIRRISNFIFTWRNINLCLYDYIFYSSYEF